MTSPARYRLTLADRWRRYRYLFVLELYLDGLPRAQQRTILSDLKASLAEAARDVGMRQAVEDLGPARSLARDFQDAVDRPRPTWNIGALTAVLTWGVLAFLALAYIFGAIDALIQQGSGTAEINFLGLPMTAWASPKSLGVEFSVGATRVPWAQLAVIGLAFAMGSKVWRLWVRH